MNSKYFRKKRKWKNFPLISNSGEKPIWEESHFNGSPGEEFVPELEQNERSFKHIAMGWASIEVKLSLLSQWDAPSFFSPKNKWIQTCAADTEFGELN